MIRVVVADDHALVRGGFQMILEAQPLSIFLYGASLSFCYVVGSFSVPGQTGTRSPNATANAFMAAFQP